MRLHNKSEQVTTSTLAHKASTLFMNHDELDQQDLYGMLYFLFKQLCPLPSNKITWTDSLRDSDSDAAFEVPRDKWMDAITSSEDCSPDMLSLLFSTSRRPGILERLFDPDRKLRSRASEFSRQQSRQVSRDQARNLLASETREFQSKGDGVAHVMTPSSGKCTTEGQDEPTPGGEASRVQRDLQALAARLRELEEFVTERLGAVEKHVLESSCMNGREAVCSSPVISRRGQDPLDPLQLPGALPESAPDVLGVTSLTSSKCDVQREEMQELPRLGDPDAG